MYPMLFKDVTRWKWGGICLVGLDKVMFLLKWFGTRRVIIGPNESGGK